MSTIFISECSIRVVFLYKEINEENILFIVRLILIIAYFISVIFIYYSFKNFDSSCFYKSLFPSLVISIYYIIGFTYMGVLFIKGIFLIVAFPILVYYFKNNRKKFYEYFGLDPEIIENMPTIPADEQHCKSCAICTMDIKLGEEIMILNCPGHHFFHGNCIKRWLKSKINCPMCRSDDVL